MSTGGFGQRDGSPCTFTRCTEHRKATFENNFSKQERSMNYRATGVRIHWIDSAFPVDQPVLPNFPLPMHTRAEVEWPKPTSFQPSYPTTIQGDRAACATPPVDFKTKVGLAWPGKSGTFVLTTTGGFAQAARSPCTHPVFLYTTDYWSRNRLHIWVQSDPITGLNHYVCDFDLSRELLL